MQWESWGIDKRRRQYVILELILINEGRSEMDDGWALLESAYILQLLFLEALQLLSLRQSESERQILFLCNRKKTKTSLNLQVKSSLKNNEN